MRYSKYIWFFLLLALLTVNSHAQYLNIVCTGDTGDIYKVSGSDGSSFIWTVSGGTIVFNYGDSVKVNWGDLPGEYTVHIQEFSKHGCPALPITGTVLVSAPVINLGGNIEICQGESVLIAPQGNFTSYQWHNGSTSPTFLAGQPGVISLEVTDQYGCKRSDDLMLRINPLPRVNLGRDTTLFGNETIILDAGSDGTQFIWSTGEITREIIAYSGKQNIWVNVSDMYNCENTDSITILTGTTNEYFKEMPTAFTPNGDGVNDEWRIPQIQAFPLAVVEIFDRWGKLIYRSEPGYSRPWNGTFQGKDMPVDSYHFIIRVNSEGMEPITGTVTLIR